MTDIFTKKPVEIQQGIKGTILIPGAYVSGIIENVDHDQIIIRDALVCPFENMKSYVRFPEMAILTRGIVGYAAVSISITGDDFAADRE